MRIDHIDRVDALSPESCQELHSHAQRVQKEARKLRAQAKRLRRAQGAEARQRQKLFSRMADASKKWTDPFMHREDMEIHLPHRKMEASHEHMHREEGLGKRGRRRERPEHERHERGMSHEE